MRVGEAHVGTGKRERMRGARWELERDGGGGAVANLGRKKGTAAAEKGAGWVKEMGVFRRGNHVTIHQLQKYEILELYFFLFNFSVKWGKILSIHALQ